jgi:hypothetical protein
MGLFLRTISPGVNRPGLKADHSLPPNAEVKNGRDTYPKPHMFHGIMPFFIFSYGETPLGTAATVWPIVPAPDDR